MPMKKKKDLVKIQEDDEDVADSPKGSQTEQPEQEGSTTNSDSQESAAVAGDAKDAKVKDVLEEKEDKTVPLIALPQSSKQKQLAGAWGQYCRSVERQYANVYTGVEKEILGVGKSLQSNLVATQETHRNVRVAKELLSQISQQLEDVDLLVVPIVLPKEGVF